MLPFIGRAERDQREGILTFLRRASLLNLLSTPVIYSIGIPLLLLDAWTTIFQRVCFPMYGIALVQRRQHVVIDRHRLPYLNAIERLHCFYCSYATGILSYVREVAARTEQYWCPIKHASSVAAPHEHYQVFFNYGDGAAYRYGLAALRRQLRSRPPQANIRRRTVMTDSITHILVPVDFSPHADHAFRYATILAHRFGARLGLLHVVEDPFITGASSSEIYVPNVPELLDNLIAGAERELATLKESAAALGIVAHTTVLTGRPAHTIVEHAKDGGFDLIVMGTRGRTGLSHVVMGSVAARVVRKAPCPVLTMRATDVAAASAKPAA